MKKANVKKIVAAGVLSSSTFFLPIVGLYLENRGVGYDTTFKLISLYAISIVIFEYPTGVVGDYFSHKSSLFWGYLITGLAFGLLSLSGTVGYYALILVIAAFGMSLMTGSLTALLSKNSDSFRGDLTRLRTFSMIWSIIAGIVGSVVFDYNIKLPGYLNAIAFFLAAGLITSVSETKKDDDGPEGNIFSKAWDGLKIVSTVENDGLRRLLWLGFILGAFFISMKWFYNPVLDEIQIPIKMWGLIISSYRAFQALGNWLYGKLGDVNYILLVLLFCVTQVFVGLMGYPLFVLISFSLAHIVRGFIQSQSDVDLAELSPDENLASIISLKSFLVRLGSSVYLAANGFLLDIFSLPVLIIVSVVFFCLISLIGVPKSSMLKKPKRA